ncbi:hypothetical protein MW887_007157 [Aspergillus wentii]|nr:hypothetical protein MW887_007157 [Aspergillus wentii]
MKLSLLLTTALVACASAAATVQSSELHTLEARACGAAGSCRGFGGGDLCNDRCKKCEGTSGKYKRGKCCGTGLQ